MVASTTRPLSHLTRNIAFGSASWTTPSNSSLSPFGSFLSRRSLIRNWAPRLRFVHRVRPFVELRVSTCPNSRLCENAEDSVRDLVDLADAVDPLQNSALFIIRQKLCR